MLRDHESDRFYSSTTAIAPGQLFLFPAQTGQRPLGTLILIFLQHELQDADQRTQISELILSSKYGKRSFNLDIPERTACMEALYAGQDFVDGDGSESISNILGRYDDINDCFPDEMRSEALPYFVDWLIENVHLVEITAYSDGDAYTIFETMNDRGLSLTPSLVRSAGTSLQLHVDSRRSLARCPSRHHWRGCGCDWGQ